MINFTIATRIEVLKFSGSDWNFKHIFTSPRNPQPNGQVEHAKQTLNKMLSRAAQAKRNLSLLLLNYRNTPIDQTRYSPAILLMSRKLRDLPICNETLKLHFINFRKYNHNIINKQL